MLVKPFNECPKTMGMDWDDFDKEYTRNDIMTAVNEQKSLDYPEPPYKVDISRDLKEYAAFQEIPNFGSHFYYAFSFEQLPKWQNFSKFKVSKKKIQSLYNENFQLFGEDEEAEITPPE